VKLDYDLIRDLLLTLETICDRNRNYPVDYVHDKRYPNHEYSIIKYHIAYLADASLIIFNDGYIFDLTPKGHAFLNNIRNQDVWNRTKETIKPLGSAALDVIANVASSIVSKFLNL
jgi:hypothetical protein